MELKTPFTMYPARWYRTQESVFVKVGGVVRSTSCSTLRPSGLLVMVLVSRKSARWSQLSSVLREPAREDKFVTLAQQIFLDLQRLHSTTRAARILSTSHQSVWVQPYLTACKQAGEFNGLIQELRLYGEEFWSYFCLDPGQFDHLLQMVGPTIAKIVRITGNPSAQLNVWRFCLRVEDIGLAVGEKVWHGSVKSAARMNSAVIFLDQVEKVNRVVDGHHGETNVCAGGAADSAVHQGDPVQCPSFHNR
ncbi:hypothetical protein N1851_005155 [Merluccius polli]|uniref:Uncharacterized protein n=1 Tax=Merluccius polli TaxID=89951 RepID=A0AA47N7E0_MERPO|nr:hypothetical protein N1851_005155 [Merluccius polli]